jgi:NADH:ubiquinone oxidoreductase subunit 6 (subunit J)
MDADKAKLAKFLNIVQTDANSSDEIKQKAGELITELAAPIYTTDLWIYRMVVIVLGITVLATIIGGLLLAFKGDPNYKLPS